MFYPNKYTSAHRHSIMFLVNYTCLELFTRILSFINLIPIAHRLSLDKT